MKRVSGNDIEYDMLVILVEHVVKANQRDYDVFLPGAPETAEAKDAILKITRGERMNTLLLHVDLQAHEQKRVFDNAEHGITKVILSTNVAETSITIPDCTMVVDTCRENRALTILPIRCILR